MNRKTIEVVSRTEDSQWENFKGKLTRLVNEVCGVLDHPPGRKQQGEARTVQISRADRDRLQRCQNVVEIQLATHST
jgi:hypothetical protein